MTKTPGQIAYEAGAEFLLENHPVEDRPVGGFADWRTLNRAEQSYWEAVGRAVSVASVPITGITRLELVDLTSRCLVLLGVPTSLAMQDEGYTLKVFVETEISKHWEAQNATALSAEPELEGLKDAVKTLAECGGDGPLATAAYQNLLKKAGL